MAEGPDSTRRDTVTRSDAARRNNPMNRLVPYLDLFARLADDELARLAGVELDVVATLRRQVVEIGNGLAQYLDLLPRLTDEELMRLTGASAKTIRFWRLCQPRHARGIEARAEISSITPMPRPAPNATPAPAEPPRKRRTTGVDMQPVAASSSASMPVANWSSEATATNAATMITPAPHQVPRRGASWDTTSPTGTATMVTPVGQTPAMWGTPSPSDTATMPAGAAASPRPTVDPAESQHGHSLEIAGEPFPGYERWRPALSVDPEDEAEFAITELDP